MGLVDIAVQMRGLMVMNKSLFVGKNMYLKKIQFLFSKKLLCRQESSCKRTTFSAYKPENSDEHIIFSAYFKQFSRPDQWK